MSAVGGLPLRAEQLLGAAFIVVVGTVNYYGIHRGALLQNLSTVLKVGALVALVLAGLVWGGGQPMPEGGVLAQRAVVGLSPFLLAMVSILWAYDGWADLSFVGGEVRDPQRTLPRALLLGTGLVVVLYLATNLVYLYLLPIEHIKGAELVAADAARLLVGPAAAVLVSGVIAVSTFGTLNGSMMTAPRIFFALAEDGLFPRAIARVDPRTSSPTGAVVLCAVLGVVFISVRTFTELAEQFIIGIWPFYALAVAGVFVLRRRRPDLERPYRAWGFPVVPVVFLLGAVFLLGNYLVSQPLHFAVDAAIILTGVPVYLAWRRWSGARAGQEPGTRHTDE
jgi:amino acid transporter